MSTICPICKTSNAGDGISYDDSFIYKCPKCGTYKISESAHTYIEHKQNLQKVSSWISEQNKIYKIRMPYIDSDKFDLIMTHRDKTIREKFNRMMKALSKNIVPTTHGLNVKMFNECYIKNQKEFILLMMKAQNEGLIYDCIDTEGQRMSLEKGIISLHFKGLTFEGHEFIESLNESNKNSNKIFMAFWFNVDIQNIFDDIVKPAIDEVGFLAERVSSSTTNLENKISDEIIGMIKSSRAVIADCTGNRTAVYYEAGYAMGMKIPVIWTCRADQVADICFDVSQHPFILWNTPEELADKIVKRLKAIL